MRSAVHRLRGWGAYPGRGIAAALALLVVASAGGVLAQSPQPAPAQADAAATQQEQRRLVIRFLTEGDFPPFNYYDDEGVLTGFNIDLARAICLEAGAACDIKVLPWDELIPALKRGEAEAIIAGHMTSERIVTEAELTDRYFHTPGRFAGRIDGPKLDITPDGLDGVKVGVARGTTHEAFLKAFFRDSRIVGFENADLAREALQQGKVDVMFDDAISLAFWLGGTLSRRCCEYKGGPYFEPKFFGDGIAIAVPRNDAALKASINSALRKVRASGRFEEIVERYFPTRIY